MEFCEFLDRFWTATTAAKVGSALVTKLENSEWRQNLRAEVAATEKKEMEKKGVGYVEEMTSKRLLVIWQFDIAGVPFDPLLYSEQIIRFVHIYIYTHILY